MMRRAMCGTLFLLFIGLLAQSPRKVAGTVTQFTISRGSLVRRSTIARLSW